MLFLWNYFIIKLIINIILIKEIVNNESKQIIYLQVKNGSNVKVINSNYIPSKVYINGIESNIDKNGNVKIEYPNNANVTLVWDQKLEKYTKLFRNVGSIIKVDLSNFDTSKATSFAYMFNNCENLNYVNFTNINTSLVHDLSFMFENCIYLRSIDLSYFDTRRVLSMESMFKNCLRLTSLDLSNFYTPKLLRMNDMFYECNNLYDLDISNMDTSSVSYMNSTFEGCIDLMSLNLSNWNTKNVILMDCLFKFCSALTSLDLSNFDTSNVINMSYMFYEDFELISLDLSNFNTSKVEYMDYMFTSCTLEYLNISSFDTSEVISMTNMFSYSRMNSLDLTNFNFNQVNLDYFFFSSSFKSIKFSREYKLVGSIYYMFYGCSSLTSLDLYNFDFALVDNMKSLFYYCNSLTSLDLSNIDSYSLTNMEYMFNDCQNLEYINFTNFMTSEVTSMNGLFYNCIRLNSLDLSSFDTYFVKNMSNMFSLCTNLKSINLENFNTSSVIDMSKMFFKCYSLESLNISNFNTSLVRDIDNMFSFCYNLTTIDLSNFNFQNLNRINILINGTLSLEYINISNFLKWNFQMHTMLEGIEKNIVYCLDLYNESENNILLPKFFNNNCSINDCSNNWKNKRKKIIVDKDICVDNCQSEESNKFEYEYKCYNQCPKGTHSIKNNIYFCEKNLEYCESNFPFISVETRSCLEECDPNDFFNYLCTINNLGNQNEIQSNLVLNISNAIENDIEFYMLTLLQWEEDLIHLTNNTLYQITSSFNLNNNNNISSLNLDECEVVLREKYNIEEDSYLIIFKIEQYFEELNIPIIQYEIFNSEDNQKLDLSCCINNNKKLNLTIPISINDNISYKYDPNNNYYNDLCYTYITESGTDISLYDRKEEYNNNYYLCQKNCSFIKYDFNNKIVICSCQIKDGFEFEEEIIKEKLISKLINKKSYSSINVLKCFKLIISKTGLMNNYGNYLLIFIIIIYIAVMFIFCFKEYAQFYEFFTAFINAKIYENMIEDISKNNLKEDSNTNSTGSIISREKPNKKYLINNNNSSLEDKIDFNNKLDKSINLSNKYNYPFNIKEREFILKSIDYEINIISYNEAFKKDKRTYFQYYLSLIKSKHLLISIFNSILDDYNSRIIKICILFFSIPLQLVINALFFNDSVLHKIYIDKRNFNIKYILPQIIYSSIISSIITSIIKRFSLTQHNILDIKHNKYKYDLNVRVFILFRHIKIKFINFFVFSFSALFLFLIYLSCFCAVYKNTQIYLFEAFLVSYMLFIFLPFILYLFPGLIRFFSFRNPGVCLYKISQMIQIL